MHHGLGKLMFNMWCGSFVGFSEATLAYRQDRTASLAQRQERKVKLTESQERMVLP